jgi:hypothetical protein
VTAVAEVVSADLSWLLLVDAAPVVARSVPGEAGGYGGLVTIRAVEHGETFFRTATAVASTELEAVAEAALAAFGVTHDLLSSLARSVSGSTGILGVTVMDREGVRFTDGEGGGHIGLVGMLPAPGRLAAATEEAEHRVLCLANAAVVISSKPGCGLEEYIEEAFARLERATCA